MSEEHKCGGDCGSCGHCGENDEERRLRLSMAGIKHKIAVMSGKGGVGKSTVAVNLAMALSLEGYKVGLLDADVHGPSVPKMLNLEDARLTCDDGGHILPVEFGALKVMSVGFMLDRPDSAVIWRGPMKIGVIRQMLSDVAWGELDYLIADCPPGTGDEPLSVCQMLDDADGAAVVTTPQQVAAADVAKSLDFCNQLGFKVLGIIENMSGFVCPKCGEITEIFAAGAGEKLAADFQVPFLGKLPIDPAVCRCGDDGKPFVQAYADTVTGKIFAGMVETLVKE